MIKFYTLLGKRTGRFFTYVIFVTFVCCTKPLNAQTPASQDFESFTAGTIMTGTGFSSAAFGDWTISFANSGGNTNLVIVSSSNKFLNLNTASGNTLSYIEVASTNGVEFKLESFQLGSVTYSGAYTITGYRNGSAVSGASYTTGTLPVTGSTTTSFNQITLTSNFQNIDRFRITPVSTVSGPVVHRLDNIVVSTAVVLPVTWLDFSVGEENGYSILNWKTAQEINTRDYLIQHSVNATDWTDIGILPAAGNTSLTQTYTYSHKQPAAGMNYYRLLQRDLDGHSSISRVVSLRINTPSGMQLLDGNQIRSGQLRLHLPSPGTVQLTTMNGTPLWRKKLNGGAHSLSTGGLVKGIYLLKVGEVVHRLLID